MTACPVFRAKPVCFCCSKIAFLHTQLVYVGEYLTHSLLPVQSDGISP